MITIGGAGGQTDPTKIAVRDLSKTEQEPLLKRVRKLLRNQYGFPRGEKNKFNVDAVFSMEPLLMPEDAAPPASSTRRSLASPASIAPASARAWW